MLHLATVRASAASGPGRVVVVGGANLDLLATTLLPARLADSNPAALRSSPGGVGRNIAQRLAELGRPVRLVAVLGDDEAGAQLLAQGQAVGIEMAGCSVLPGLPTARYLSIHQPDGELLVAVNDMAITAQLTPQRLQPHWQALATADAVVVEANLGEPTLATLWALPAEVPIWADAVSAAKCTRLLGGLARLHTLKPNRLEALQLSGLPEHTPDAALARWCHQQGVQQVALSLGPQGLLLSERQADGTVLQHHEPAPAVPPGSNVTGAGDALLAGLLHAQLGGAGLAERAAQAVANAARALSGQALLRDPTMPARALNPTGTP